MPDNRSISVAKLFKQAIERQPNEWQSFLTGACGADPNIRAEVESLLEHHRAGEHFLERSAAKMFVPEATLRPGEQVEGYRIESLIATGGMGEVYLALDVDLNRKVALKLVQRGLGTQQILRRFRQEEQILAALNHPNIAQLYGSGLTAEDVPFFAMEYVSGKRLDEFCAQHALNLRERLQLFRKICGAVAYAHQHLVIHRDLKPSNIRVTEEGEPKLLDFGIARILDVTDELPVEATLTIHRLMTPEYASPEQLTGERMTTASDIYSLGVILFELLTGQKPYRLTSRTPEGISRAIAQRRFERPSVVARQKSLRGDLDNIVAMALRREPERRYRSAGQLGEDIRRHLQALPVIARADTMRYRAGKFVQRHTALVAATVLLAIAIIGGLVAATWQARAAREQRDLANAERVKAEAINQFLQEMLNRSNPVLNKSGESSRDVTLGEALDDAARLLASGAFAAQPRVRAELQQIIALSYHMQGRYDIAAPIFEEAIAAQKKLYGENTPQALIATGLSATRMFAHGDLSAAEKAFRAILPPMREQYKRGNLKALRLADALNDFGALRRTQGDSKEAATAFREALALAPEIPKESLWLVSQLRSELASTLADQGRFPEALATSRAAVEEYQARGETAAPDYGFTLTIFGGFLSDAGAHAEADDALAQAEKIFRATLHPTHLWLGDNLRNSAISFYRQARYDEALSHVQEARRIYEESFGRHYDHYPTCLIIEGLCLTKRHQFDRAEELLRQAVQLRRDTLPPNHPWIAIAESALGECLHDRGNIEEARRLLTLSYQSLRASQGEDNPRTTEARERLSRLQTDR